MCGLTGFWDRRNTASADALGRLIAGMHERLLHRGPDDSGTWLDASVGLALGFRRLAIVDLSPTGHQPMTSADGRYVIAYNGEVYNYRELRRELEAAGIGFRGTSDTEVIVEAVARWGIRPAVERLIGMFAISLWDRQRRELTLVRDRLGIKPVYWAKFGELILFGSELKALRAHPGWTAELDRSVLPAFLQYAYVPTPRTIYRGVHKLEPGTLLQVGAGGEARIERYWDLAEIARTGQAAPLAISEAEATRQLDTLLRDAVKRRMVADVPLGAFLSGGVDSSTVAALMQAQSDRPVRTFTIGFHEAGYNEAEHAKAVAAHLGTDHTELYVEPDHARDLIPKLPDFYDEPFADSSQIPTLLISELTRRHVTVALSGDGGDELFAGYNRYLWAQRIWGSIGWLPRPVRDGLARAIRALPPPLWDQLFRPLPGRIRPPLAGDKMHKIARILGTDGPDAIYRRLISQWEAPEEALAEPSHAGDPSPNAAGGGTMPSLLNRMRYLDTVTYLPEDILTKLDRASMGFSLEARVPLLDHRVVAFAWQLPPQHLLHQGTTKWLLRKVLYQYVPRPLIERPKMGFSVPIDAWLRGPLRDWAEDLLAPQSLQEAGLRPEPIRWQWQHHLSGERNSQYQLWPVLMLQCWRRRWLAADGAARTEAAG